MKRNYLQTYIATTKPYVVREKPIINDATIFDAVRVGLDKVAKVISSGSDAPATILSQCSPELKNIYDSADVIIAGGKKITNLFVTALKIFSPFSK